MPTGSREERPSYSKASAKANVPARQDERPQRSNRGKGGVREQLAAVADLIRPDLNPGAKRSRTTKEIPDSVPVNVMAPPAKKRRGEKTADLPMPVMNDPPLNLNVPKPSYARSHSRTAFGFQAMAIPDADHPQDIPMADGVDDTNKIDEGADGSTDLVVDEMSPDEDERFALRSLKADPPHDMDDIGANSESESEPIPQPPKRGQKVTRHHFISSDDEQDEDPHEVLDMYYRKNKQIKPPASSSNSRRVSASRSYQVPAVDHSDVSANHSQVPVDRSDAPAERSQVPAECSQDLVDRSNVLTSHSQVPVDHSHVRSQVPVDRSHVHSQVPVDRSHVRSQVPVDRSHVRSQVPVDHSHVRSQVLVDRSHVRSQVPVNHSHVRSQVLVDRSSASANPSNPDEADDDDDASDSGGKKLRATRNSKSHGDAKPSQLGYYSGTWVDVLITARNIYRKRIHTYDPFPDRNLDSLKDAQNILLEVIAEFKEDGGEVDNTVYSNNNSGMITYIFEDGAAYRGRLKIMGRDVVKLHYRAALDPEIEGDHNSDQREQVIAENVKKLLDESLFLQGPPDSNGRPENFGHSAITDLIKRFYYNGKSECLSTLFPDVFKICPRACLSMACACIVNCLHEWQLGYESKVPFTGDQYESVHQAMSALIDELEQHEYHGPKLKKLLKKIAQDAKRLQNFKRGNPKAHGFKIFLD